MQTPLNFPSERSFELTDRKTGKPVLFGFLPTIALNDDLNWERVFVKCPRKRTFDTLSIHAYTRLEGQDFGFAVQGLYKGSYADAIVEAQALYNAAKAAGLKRLAGDVRHACEAHPEKITLTNI